MKKRMKLKLLLVLLSAILLSCTLYNMSQAPANVSHLIFLSIAIILALIGKIL